MDNRILRNLDIPLIFCTLALILFGIVAVYSATQGLQESEVDPLHYVKRQILLSVIGMAACILLLTIDYRVLLKWSSMIYIFIFVLLLSIMFFGSAAMGAERWLSLGPFRLQPSELAKISLVIVLAAYLHNDRDLKSFTDLFLPILLTFVLTILVLLQPDLGTAFVFVGILLGMLFFAGSKIWHLLILISTGIFFVFAAAFLSSRGLLPLLKDYQLRRLIIFLDPYADMMGAGWNVIQSMIAIGSGGFFGKGLFGGSQTQLNFLPARHTDFIFSVVGEEFGFLGAVLLLALYCVFLWRCICILISAKDSFGMLLVAGVTSMITFHVVVNVGMTLGMLPITGLPLPFISYGGSSLLSNLIGVGLILNVGTRRKKIQF